MSASSSVPPETSTPKRDRLLDTAAALFYRDGYHAVGIDRILAESGLAKMTLYHHFASKEELIVAALERRGLVIGTAIAAALDAAGSSPRKRLQALFDWHERWFDSREFNGCAFIRAVGEYPEADSPVHQAVVRHKTRVRAKIAELLSGLQVSDPAGLAKQILLLLEGAIVSAHTFGDPTIIRSARDAALTLIKADAG